MLLSQVSFIIESFEHPSGPYAAVNTISHDVFPPFKSTELLFIQCGLTRVSLDATGGYEATIGISHVHAGIGEFTATDPGDWLPWFWGTGVVSYTVTIAAARGDVKGWFLHQVWG